jgi:hypothetical protein
MKLIKRFLVLILLLSVFVVQTKGQKYKAEFGLMGGKSFYMGDVNANELFYNNRSSFSLFYRYNLNGRFSLKANMGMYGIAGNTSRMQDEFPNWEDVGFERKLVDAGVHLEMNFFEYGMPSYVSGSNLISPYVFVGFGITGFKTDALKATPHIPFGVGLKLKVLPRINLGVEWSLKKTYDDNLDYLHNSSGFSLSDPLGIKSDYNKNKDWYSALALFIGIDLQYAGSKCYR